jgi:hypothetical protein
MTRVGLTDPAGTVVWHTLPAWWCCELLPSVPAGRIDLAVLEFKDRAQVICAAYHLDPRFNAAGGWAVEITTEGVSDV